MPNFIDPYLEWAKHTGFRDYPTVRTTQQVTVIVECLDGETVPNLIASVRRAGLTQVSFSALYSDLPADLKGVRYCTALVALAELATFSNLVKRLELGNAIVPVQPMYEGGGGPNSPRLRFDQKELAKPLIAFIDDFIAFENAAFLRNNSRSRFISIWNQDRKPPIGPWTPAFALGYGSISSPSTATSLGNRGAYPSVLRRTSHGTHVASLGAGQLAYGNGTPAMRNPMDEAAEAELLAVFFPKEMVADTSGGALATHVLDALHFVAATATSPAIDGTLASIRPVVVNLSFGTFAGAHDGTSILEEALDELISLRGENLTIVVPSGNQYEARCHAQFALNPQQATQNLTWQLMPDDATPSFLELWLPEGEAGKIKVSVVSPSGQSICSNLPVGSNSAPTPALPFAGVYFPTANAGSTTRTGALVALAATQRSSAGHAVAEHGLWKISVALVDSSATVAGDIHAWIERDDASLGHRVRGRQSRFADTAYLKYRHAPGQPPDMAASLVKRAGSFNSIANGQHTVVVGALVASPDELAHYSGSSPGIAGGVDVAAISETSRALRGVRGAANLGAGTSRLRGTSVAAPLVSRWVANRMPSPVVAHRTGLATVVRPGANLSREGLGRLP